jgi:hypothetical protein
VKSAPPRYLRRFLVLATTHRYSTVW